jgi:ribonuclease-3
VAGVESLRALIDDLPEELARQSLTHTSWTKHRADSYLRLAFIGDSVLSLAVSTEIYPRFPRKSAGRLTTIRAQAVSRRSCAKVAAELGIPEMLRTAAPEGEGRSAETLLETERTLAELMEAFIGACYLHFGYETTAAAVVEAFAGQVDFAVENLVDFKSALQEALAREGVKVSYRVVAEDGPPHARSFTVVADVEGKSMGQGRGRSKKDAEQAAAGEALKELSG